MEMGIKSKEARKYIFNCLDDMMQVYPNKCITQEMAFNMACSDCLTRFSLFCPSLLVINLPGQPFLSLGGN